MTIKLLRRLTGAEKKDVSFVKTKDGFEETLRECLEGL